MTGIGRRGAGIAGMMMTGLLLLAGCTQPDSFGPDSRPMAKKQKKSKSAPVFRSLPVRDDEPDLEVRSESTPEEAGLCLQQKLQSEFRLPPEFYLVETYEDRARTVVLVNPFTGTRGIQMDVVPAGLSGSLIRLYGNGATLSRAWKRLPANCR